MIGVLAPDATINDNAPAAYRGLDRFVARKKVVADLDALGLLVETKKHRLVVPRCARTGQIVEPMLTDQWFMAMTKPGRDGQSIAGRAMAAVERGDVRFVPPQWVNTWNQWMKNIQDWCISRQLWWGHQIPAWYGAGGEIFVARSEEEARTKADAAGYRGALTRDADVLDTWYSAAQFPFSTVGWPGETIEQTALRELHEELGIETAISCLAPIAFASHGYEKFHLLMPVFACRKWRGAPQPREGQTLKWVAPIELGRFPMPPADLPLVGLLRDLL